MDEKREQNYYCFLYLNDSLIRTKTIESFDNWDLDSLNKGVYRIELTKTDNKRILSYSDILVANDSVTSEDIMLGRSMPRKKPEYEPNPFEFNISCLYGNNRYFEEQKVHSKNQMTTLRMGFLGKDAVSKFNQICFYFGASGSGTVFEKDTSTYKGLPVRNKWYSGFCLDFTLSNRFTFYNGQKYCNTGFFVDAGISYSLPLYYRETITLDRQTKIKTKYIHTYSDFYLMARIGFKQVAITGEYNISTFLKNSYTEVPAVRIGLAFCIPMPD